MGMRTCMNISCGTTSCSEWKNGWKLRSGELANLCDKCGYAFEQRIYCEEYHSDDSGWRKCFTCGKLLHCGCVASLSLIEILDIGGVKCIGCAKNSAPNFSWTGAKSGKYRLYSVTENTDAGGNHKGSNGINKLTMPQHLQVNSTFGILKPERLVTPQTQAPAPLMDNTVISGGWGAAAKWASPFAQASMGSFLKDKLDVSTNNMQTKDGFESVTLPNLSISLGAPSGNLQFTSGTMSNAFNQGFASPSLVPSPSKLPFSPASAATDTNTIKMPKLRAARPPNEGRGRQQPLPRYWPRITDQELQKICGDSNCTIMPLFEKVLSASDASRIGRLVLPKACAEAYFPSISQAEGLPIHMQDVNGKEWVFQFRFWPNNNSRMYVLEGVTPCMQSMQLQAGDTVTFSRKEPEGKFVLGFRKSSSNSAMQDVPVTNGCSSLPQSMKGSMDFQMNALPKHIDSSGGNVYQHNSEKSREVKDEGLLPSSSTGMKEKKRGRKIGSKTKRLLIDSQEVQALKLTWEEVQGMLRPPPNAKPGIVMIDGFEIEEYEEPPVFGKSSVFATHSSGEVEQWVQCDSCSKWRKLPVDVLLPPKWTCAENIGDPIRCRCSAPDELNPMEMEKFSHLSKDSKKQKVSKADNEKPEQESSALSALANAAVLGGNSNEVGTSDAVTTTKHPRHRVGCTCIVCIQPPSGKGKHKSTCTCTVCLTVKRRFKTMMMRKKKRLSTQEAQTDSKNVQKHHDKEDDEADAENDKSPEDDSLQTEQNDDADNGFSLNLNLGPEREEDSKTWDDQMSFGDLMQLANVPLESYANQNGLRCSTSEDQPTLAPHIGDVAREILKQRVASPQDQLNPSEVNCEPEKSDKHPSDPQ